MAYCLKYIHTLRSKVRRSDFQQANGLTSNDLLAADHTLVRLAQAQVYSEELDGLKDLSSYSESMK